MSSGPTRGLRLAAFFIVAMFATSRFPRADETNAVTALGEHDRKETTGLRAAQQGYPRFVDRMARIINHDAERVSEGRRGLIEGHPCLRSLAAAFRGSHSNVKAMEKARRA